MLPNAEVSSGGLTGHEILLSEEMPGRFARIRAFERWSASDEEKPTTDRAKKSASAAIWAASQWPAL